MTIIFLWLHAMQEILLVLKAIIIIEIMETMLSHCNDAKQYSILSKFFLNTKRAESIFYSLDDLVHTTNRFLKRLAKTVQIISGRILL